MHKRVFAGSDRMHRLMSCMDPKMNTVLIVYEFDKALGFKIPNGIEELSLIREHGFIAIPV